MEGIIDDDPVNNPAAAHAGQQGPFTDLMSQFQQNRSAAAGAGQYGGYGGYGAAQQQPVMDWGQGFHTAQQQALANMTGYGGMDPAAAAGGGEGDADVMHAKRQRMEEQAMMAAAGMAGGPHTSSSTNQLQALGNPNAGWHQGGGGNQMVEGNDLTQVYEQARAQQAYQQQAYQQQQQQQQQQGMYAGYGAGLMDNYAEAPINNLHPSDLQQQMMMQQQQQHLQPGAYNLNQGAGRTRLDPIGRPAGYSSRVPVPAAQTQPSRLTTGHKHAEYLQNLVRARFNNPSAAGGAAGGMVTRSATNSFPPHTHHGMQYPGYYQQFGMPGHEDDRGEEEADQVLSKCEAVSAGQMRGFQDVMVCRSHSRRLPGQACSVSWYITCTAGAALKHNLACMFADGHMFMHVEPIWWCQCHLWEAAPLKVLLPLTAAAAIVACCCLCSCYR
jgi:hypothetical protein